MADGFVNIYTLQLKRIIHALKNLDEGLEFTEDFKVRHSIDSKLTKLENLPKDFTESDYDVAGLVLADVKALLLKFKSFQEKFEAFNEPNTLDPLEFLGKRFHVRTEEIRDL